MKNFFIPSPLSPTFFFFNGFKINFKNEATKFSVKTKLLAVQVLAGIEPSYVNNCNLITT